MSVVSLLCLPYAGGSSAIFRSWSRLLPNWIQVHAIDLPGHGSRHGETSILDWDELTGWVTAEMTQKLRGPYAIFGHSMGALVGFEFAHAMCKQYDRSPVWLGAAGCRAPCRRKIERKWLSCPENEFIAELRRLGGTPPELLENRELLDLVLPVLRGDFHLSGIYEHRHRLPLSCPITVLAGAKDADVFEPRENLTDWRIETTGAFNIETLNAGHFFLGECRDNVLASIVRALSSLRFSGGAIHA